MAAVISPGERLRLRWSDNCAQLIVQIPREALEARLAERSGFKQPSPLRFRAAFDLRRSAARDWRALLDFTVRSIDAGGLFSRGPLCAHLLGTAGARVVKVETADRLDGARRGEPAFYDLLNAIDYARRQSGVSVVSGAVIVWPLALRETTRCSRWRY